MSFTGDLELPGVVVAGRTGGDGLPERVGIAIDLPGATGEGELVKHRPQQWRGVVELSLGPVSVSGLAILDVDDRQAGVLVIMAAEFAPPIQLSFGFTLIGVGGVVGVNRAPNFERLRQTAATTDLSRVLFPRDPKAEADRLLPVVDACFSRRPGAFVVGPTVKIGWTAVVSATVAVLVSDQDATIVGRIAVGLPTERFALVRLEANVVGRADAHGLAIDATLANSHIVGILVEGDIRLRMLTTGGGLFALSAGGFHPAFPAPDGMADMRRVGMHLSYGPLRARLEAYVAVTTSSAQFGARVELQVGAGGWGIQGHMSFDTLFLFDPFRFELDYSARVAVQAAGIDVVGVSLSGHLAGPAPWRISGRASVRVLLARIPVPFPTLTWGDEAQHPALPPAPDPVAELERELRRRESWTTTTDGAAAFVRLRPRAGDRGAVHPWAQIGFRQRRVPLGETLARMDGIPLGAPVALRVDCPTGRLTFHDEDFVAPQFFDVDDAQRLAGAGFTSCPASFDVDTAGHRAGRQNLARAPGYQVAVREGRRADGRVVELRPRPAAAPPPRRPGISHRRLRAQAVVALRHRWPHAVTVTSLKVRRP